MKHIVRMIDRDLKWVQPQALKQEFELQMVMFGWYLVLMLHRDSAAAVSATT